MALAILIYGVRKDIGGVIENLGKVNTLALLLMIPIEILNYDAYARLYVSLFKILGEKVSYRDMYKVNLELNFVNHILPSGGVSGIILLHGPDESLRHQRPQGHALPADETAAAVRQLPAAIDSGRLLFGVRGHVNNLIMVVASSLVTLLVVGTFGFIYMIESRQRINTVFDRRHQGPEPTDRTYCRRRPETINVKGAQEAFSELHDNYRLFKENWRQLKDAVRLYDAGQHH